MISNAYNTSQTIFQELFSTLCLVKHRIALKVNALSEELDVQECFSLRNAPYTP